MKSPHFTSSNLTSGEVIPIFSKNPIDAAFRASHAAKAPNPQSRAKPATTWTSFHHLKWLQFTSSNWFLRNNRFSARTQDKCASRARSSPKLPGSTKTRRTPSWACRQMPLMQTLGVTFAPRPFQDGPYSSGVVSRTIPRSTFE